MSSAAKPKLKVREEPEAEPAPEKILVVDVGGTNLKILTTGQTEPRKTRSGKKLTPAAMVERVTKLAEGWEYEAVALGYPGPVGERGPKMEPKNLGKGWVGFDYTAAFGLPVKMMNDAAMQALGSYEGGRMLFLGLGTGLGTTLIYDRVIVPLELGQIWFRQDGTVDDYISRRGCKRLGCKEWCKVVDEVTARLIAAFVVDYIVLGGGNAKKVKQLPPGCRLGHNQNAFVGGFRLWNLPVAPIYTHPTQQVEIPAADEEWKLV
jgi:polyphosphate glucokinase